MTHAGKVAHVHDPEHVALPLWRETFAAFEYLGLKASGAYYGCGVPRGEGEPVVVVPGFLGSDLYLVELYLWLGRIGYTPYMSKIGHNATCPDVLTQRLVQTVNRAHKRSGQKVYLVGHSLGGVLSRGAACMAPDEVAGVITLASPFRGIRVNPTVRRAVELVRARIRLTRRGREGCFTEHCNCGFTSIMRSDFPAHIPQTCLYTKEDGVVDWNACRNDNPATDIEVQGTHVGLAWNAEVYRAIARRLSEMRDERAALDAARASGLAARNRRAASRQAVNGGRRTSRVA